MESLSLDLETFSSIDITKSGVYKYAESPDFSILLFGYSVDGGDVNVIDLANGEEIPAEIIAARTDENVQKWAHNSAFERICISRWLHDNVNKGNIQETFMNLDMRHVVDVPWASRRAYHNTEIETPKGTPYYLNPRSWRCTMVWSAYMGLPLSLEGVGAVLKLDEQKLREGKDLIRYFCMPCIPTKANGGRTRNLPSHAPEKWEAFKAYNRRDVEVEIAIQNKLAKFPVPESIWEEYWLDQEINDRGVQVDMTLVHNAIIADERARTELIRLMKEITELDNSNSVSQIKQWLSDNGLETDTLGKKAISEMLKNAPHKLRRALELRQSLTKSSVRKYTAIENAVCSDGRVRGMFQFYGANRTGRWAGRLIQLQNLPANHIKNIEQCRLGVRLIRISSSFGGMSTALL